MKTHIAILAIALATINLQAFDIPKHVFEINEISEAVEAAQAEKQPVVYIVTNQKAQ